MPSTNATAAVRYTPGSWLGVVRSGTVVLLHPDSTPALVESLWELLGTGPEAPEVLDTLSAASGGSLARLPWFAIVAGTGSLQLFLRGGIDLTVELPGGPVELSGRDVTTWTERRFETADGFSLRIPGAEAAGAPRAAAELPLADGVVLLQGLRMDLRAAALPGALTAAGAGADGASAETVLAYPVEDLELERTLHGEPEPEPEPEPAAAAPAEPEPAAAEPEPEPEPAAAGREPAGPDQDQEASGAQKPAASEPAEQEPTGSYDHLWEQTVMRNIEDAAVREDPDADSELSGDFAETPPGPTPEPAAAVAVAEPAAAPAPAPDPPAAPHPVSTGLIDSVPWHTGGDRSSPAAPAPAPALAPLPAVPLPTAAQQHVPMLPAARTETDADHDGQTIIKGDLAGAGPQPPSTQRAAAEQATGPMVLARVCPQGHANPSTCAQCGRCGQPLPGDGVQVRRPRLGQMRLSTGELIDLTQSLIVGRQPSVSRVQGAVMPKLIQVASPSGDISRSHVEVRLEGWHVMLCDLKATNGTVLVREGQPPRRLAQGEMAIVLDGDIAEVGDGISLRFEEIP
ncbi:MAG: FHA domain-containing protein [Arthrobacter sp.]